MINVFGYDIFNSKLTTISTNKRVVINTINPHSYCVALKDSVFRDALLDSDILLPDGIGIVYASRILKNKKIKKISGADIHQHLINKANVEGGKVFYLGASTSTLKKIGSNIKLNYPNIQLETFSPHFKPQFSAKDTSKMVEAVNAFQPDYLFVGMTAPKQEKWVYENRNKLNATLICSIGAVFDFYAGTVQRSSQFWISLGLEWFPRLLREPKRLWRRNFISTPRFIIDVLGMKLGLIKRKET